MPKKQIGKKIDAQGNLTDLGYTVTQEEINSWNNKVDNTRKINNKPLSSDITLNANDVGALPNTTVIPDVSGLPTKNDLNDLKTYDLIINSQEKFDAFCESLDNGTCNALSVLITKQENGNPIYEKTNGKGLYLPFTLFNFHCVSGATISFNNFNYDESTNPALIYGDFTYDLLVGPETLATSVKNVTLTCGNSTGKIVAFKNLNNLTNCRTIIADEGGTATEIISFESCYNINNGSSFIAGYNPSVVAYHFSNCININNICNVQVVGNASNCYDYYNCKNISNYDNSSLELGGTPIETFNSGCSGISAIKEDIPNISNFITKDVDNLTNYTLSVDEASKIQLSMNNSTYVLTVKMLNSKNEELSSSEVDFPLESMVVNATYDSTNKQIILTLKNGTTTSFSVADLVSGLATQSALNTTNTNVANLTTRVSTNETNIAKKLDKVTYEYNRELAIGSTGKVLVGKFPMYDSNVTINVSSTTNTTYNGTLVIASQNINDAHGGSYVANVYGDPAGTLSSAFVVKYPTNSRVFEVYCNFPSWSKNLIHIKAVALSSAPSNIVELVTTIPTDSLVTVNNVLKSAIPTKTSQLTNDSSFLTGITSAQVTSALGYTPYNSTNPNGYVTSSGSVESATNATKLNNQDASYYLNYNNFTNTPTIPDVSGFVPNTRTINGKSLSSNISLGNKDVGALPDYTLTINHGTAGNPRMVKFASVNYSSAATCFKMGAMTCHDNGVSYQFLTDMLIAVTTAGDVTANIYKFAQSSVGNVDGVARYTGDVFYVNDTTNKIVDFYILCGQYSSSQFTPVTKVGSTTISYVTQYSGTATYYSSGDKVWVNGCGTTYARISDIPDTSSFVTTNTEQTITGKKIFNGNGLTVSGRTQGSGDDEGIVVSTAANSYAGLCLGSPSGMRSVFYLNTSSGNAWWRYNAGGATSYDLQHPKKSGTIATTDDLGTQATYSLSGTTLTITPK